MSNRDAFIEMFAGGCAGAMGATATCPLEVVKTRLQSSTFTVMSASLPAASGSSYGSSLGHKQQTRVRKLSTSAFKPTTDMVHISQLPQPQGSSRASLSLFFCLRYIIEVEGPRALWKGLGANLAGVAPSRAIYFCSYLQTKRLLMARCTLPDSTFVHFLSSAAAGFTSITATNPIWFVKTRLQLDYSSFSSRPSILDCIRRIYCSQGILGFYKGVTASYYGISETIIYWCIYEAVKSKLHSLRQADLGSKSYVDYLEFMLAAAMSKTIASCLCYPHEVARTRLREEGKKYQGFWQTLGLVLREEGWIGLYRGFTTQLIRQIPNTAIMMATFEGVLYLLKRNSNSSDFYTDDDDDYAESEYG